MQQGNKTHKNKQIHAFFQNGWISYDFFPQRPAFFLLLRLGPKDGTTWQPRTAQWCGFPGEVRMRLLQIGSGFAKMF